MRGICALLSLLLTLPAYAQEPLPPRDRTEWLTRLRTLHSPLTRDDYLSLNQFQALDAGTVYSMIHDAWSEISSESAKAHLVQYAAFEPSSPYLFKIIHLGRTDKSAFVQKTALRSLRLLTFLDMSDDAAYQEWYKENETRPLPQSIQQGCQKFAVQLRQATGTQQVVLLNTLLEFPFITYQHLTETGIRVEAGGLIGVRRAAAFASSIVPLLLDLITPNTPIPVQQKALACIAHLYPDGVLLRQYESRLRPLISRLLRSEEAAFAEKISLLSSFRTDWAVEPLLKLAEQGIGQQEVGTIIQGLVGTGSGRVAPMLIALIDYAEQDRELLLTANAIQFYLSRMLEVPGEKWNSSQWREWWYNNRNAYEPSFTKQPFPRLEVLKSEKTYYRRICLPIYIDKELKPAYQFISSGLILDSRGQNSKTSLSRPGLIVVLDSSEKPPITLGGRWQEVVEEVVHGGYVVALISETNLRPERVRAIVQHIVNHVPIDPKRVFLNGNGTLGKVAYSCSLESTTPFRGFWMKDSPFTLAGLHNLKAAQNRHYYLQSTPKGNTPYLQSLVAQDRLSSAGAKISLERSETALTANQLRAALTWLEKER